MYKVPGDGPWAIIVKSNKESFQIIRLRLTVNIYGFYLSGVIRYIKQNVIVILAEDIHKSFSFKCLM